MNKIKISLGEKLRYGFSDIGVNLAFYMITSYFMLFLTDVAGIDPKVVGTIFLIAMLFDAVNDPIIGAMADRTRTKLGTYRPWMIFSALPYCVITVLCFINVPFSTGGKVAWYLIFYCLFTVGETSYAMAQGALPALMTDDADERNLMGVFRDWGANFAGFILGLVVVPIIMHFSADGQSLDARGYLYCTIILCAAALICLWIAAFGTKERIVPEAPEKKQNFKVLFGSFLKNRPAICIVCMVLFVNIFIGFRGNFTTYYAIYYLGSPEKIATLFTVMYTMPLLGLLFVPKLQKVIGPKMLFIISGVFAILSGVFGLLGGHNMVMVIISYVFAGLTLSGVYANIWGNMPTCADYGEWKTGIAAVGFICSLATFSMKVGGALASYGSGWLLTLGKYDATLEVQSEFTQNFIYMANGILPIICGIIAILLIMPYNLDKDTIEKVRVDLDARRQISE